VRSLTERMARRSRRREAGRALFAASVAQARQPQFYAELGVPDTLDGRFDLIVLHAVLVVRRVRRAGGEGGDTARAMVDTMFEDMDRSLRELGVGDLSVGRKVKAMARAFLGRAMAYEDGLAGNGPALEHALRRNVFGTTDPAPRAAAALASYVRRQDRHLAKLPDEGLLAGRLEFMACELSSLDRQG
jgi:cytochrome b pre-mRNA-processing protein 3